MMSVLKKIWSAVPHLVFIVVGYLTYLKIYSLNLYISLNDSVLASNPPGDLSRGAVDLPKVFWVSQGSSVRCSEILHGCFYPFSFFSWDGFQLMVGSLVLLGMLRVLRNTRAILLYVFWVIFLAANLLWLVNR